jgi:hypothetical protein
VNGLKQLNKATRNYLDKCGYDRNTELLSESDLHVQAFNPGGFMGNVMRSGSPDALETSYTPKVHLYIAVSLVAMSLLMFVFGIKPSSLEGSRSANGFGWLCGAVCAPVLTLMFRQADNKNSFKDAYIPNLQTKKAMTFLLFISVALSVVHSFFWALERSF